MMEVVKSMIHDQDLPMCLWVEASITTTYVHNIIFLSALGNKTPEEMFTREKHVVIHLNIFGCPVYTYTFPRRKYQS